MNKATANCRNVTSAHTPPATSTAPAVPTRRREEMMLAGVPVWDHIQGRCLVPLLQDNATDWRRSVLIEFYTYENPFPWLLDMDYRAIRAPIGTSTSTGCSTDESELYDLAEDPYETRNLIDDPRLAASPGIYVRNWRRRCSK